MSEILTQSVFEIKHNTNMSMLYNSGLMIDVLLSSFKLQQFGNVPTGFTVADIEKGISLFLHHDRFGISILGNYSDSEVKSMFQEFLSIYMAFEKTVNEPFIHRIGVRKKTLYPYNNKFQELVTLFNANYICIPDVLLTKLDLDIKDVGYPLIFKKDDYIVRTNCGPVEKQQIEVFFPHYPSKDIVLPEVGIYIDIDCSSSPKEKTDIEVVTSKVDEHFNVANNKMIIIRDLILGAKNGS